MNSSLEEDSADKDEDTNPFSELTDFCTRIQSLISELLLLSSRIPEEFTDGRYDHVLFDLRYLDASEDYERKIEGNAELGTLDEHIRDSCSLFLPRFYLLANGIIVYYQEIVEYLNELQEDVYMSSITENENGKQLLTESLSLFGCLLLLMEHFMGGYIREKLLVACIRHDYCFDAPNINDVCLLCRVHMPLLSGSVHHVHSSPTSIMITTQKVDELFRRFPFPRQVVNTIIRHLRDDDLYRRLHHYPHPEHRTVALALQAGYLYVMLFYSPEILHDVIVMREIVDRFFKDCWVVPIFLYFTIDLTIAWDSYKAAKSSLSSCISPSFVRENSQHHCSKVKDTLMDLDSMLLSGNLTREYALNNSQSLVSLIRIANISLRWLLLHRSSSDKKLRDIVASLETLCLVDDDILLHLFLKLSQFEFQVKQIFEDLLEGKEQLWRESKANVSICMQELAKYCSQSQGLPQNIKGENMPECFERLSMEVMSFDYMKNGNVGKKIRQVISSLKETEKIHRMEENLQVKQHTLSVQKTLQSMLRALNLKTDHISTLSVITDVGYASGYIDSYSEMLCKKIEQDPTIVSHLHAFFLKFRPVLDIPLHRFSKDQSADYSSVFDYYLSQYLAPISTMLESIPTMLFQIFDDNAIHPSQSLHSQNRVEMEDLQHMMQMDQRFHLTKAFNQISILFQGVQMLHLNFMDLVDLDVKRWIENGMRKEISSWFTCKLKAISFPARVSLEDLEAKMQQYSAYILQRFYFMECLQDLIHIDCTRIWNEEYARIFYSSVKEEYDDYLKRKNQSVPTYANVNDFSKANTLLGRLLHQLLLLTDPCKSMYIEPMCGWFDAEGIELMGLRFFDLLQSCIGPVGMYCLDSLFTFLIVEHLENATNRLKCLRKSEEPSWESWTKSLACIGQLQLLRGLIACTMKSESKVKASLLSSSIEAMIASISSQWRRIPKGTTGKDEKVFHFLPELYEQAVICGLVSPLEAIYLSKDPPDSVARCASSNTISLLSQYVFDTHLGTLTTRIKKITLDFASVIIGLGTFLKQFHPIYTTEYVKLMGEHIQVLATRDLVDFYKTQRKLSDQSLEFLKTAFWLIQFCKYMDVSKELLDSCLPPSFFAILQT